MPRAESLAAEGRKDGKAGRGAEAEYAADGFEEVTRRQHVHQRVERLAPCEPEKREFRDKIRRAQEQVVEAGDQVGHRQANILIIMFAELITLAEFQRIIEPGVVVGGDPEAARQQWESESHHIFLREALQEPCATV